MNIDKKVNHVHKILPFRFSFIYLLGILVSGSIKIWAFLGVKFQFIAHNKTWSDIATTNMLDLRSNQGILKQQLGFLGEN
jgi:hypothetical protein